MRIVNDAIGMGTFFESLFAGIIGTPLPLLDYSLK